MDPINTTNPLAFSVRNSLRTGTTATAKPRKANPFNWKLWFRNVYYEHFAHSLFFKPSLAVIVGIVSAALLLVLDKALLNDDNEGSGLPVVLTTTVESARAVLGTIAGATISFAGIAFSVSLLVIQLGSSQLSPRIITTLFTDDFNKNVMALVVGTFTYCLVVLRSVRHALEGVDGDMAIVPNISVGVAVVLGILSILATVAFIDHAAHAMDVSQLLEKVTRQTIVQIRLLWVEAVPENSERNNITIRVEFGQDGEISTACMKCEDTDDSSSSANSQQNADDGAICHVVRFRRSGWVQEVDLQGMLPLVPSNGKIQLHTIEGRYPIPGVAVCTISIPRNMYDELNGQEEETDGEANMLSSSTPASHIVWLEKLEDNILNCLQIGNCRTMRLDPSYGLRELVDVTLRALSPGVNDPTTAQDGIFHAAAVVIEFLKRNPPPHRYMTPQGGVLILGEQQDHDGIVRLAYDEARKCAASSPTVCVYLMESLRLIRESLRAQGLEFRAPEIERQVRLIEEGCLRTNQIKDDHLFITQARKDRFSDNDLMIHGVEQSRRIPRKDDMITDEHMQPTVVPPPSEH